MTAAADLVLRNVEGHALTDRDETFEAVAALADHAEATDRPVVAFREDMHVASLNGTALEHLRAAMPDRDRMERLVRAAQAARANRA